MKDKYKTDIIITRLKNRSPIISFKDIGHEILYQAWYDQRKENMNDEKLRIVKCAGEIIVDDIRSKIYDCDEYPSPMNFLGNIEDDVPESLRVLLETIILKNKRGDLDKWKVKITGIAHAIIAATRPRSFISPILTALSSFFLRRYGSSTLLDMLSAFGFAASYKESRVFEISCVLSEFLKCTPPGHFNQFVFDNVDHQTCSLNGYDTLHAMAGIQCITPPYSELFQNKIPRIQKIPSSSEVGKYGRVELLTFNRVGPGLASVNVENLQDLNPLTYSIEANTFECMWFYEKYRYRERIPGLSHNLIYFERIIFHQD